MTLVLLISGGLLIHSFARLGRWLRSGVLPSDAYSSSEARSERRTGFGPSGFPRWAYLSKPRMYGMFGGRSPFSNIGPRVVWYFMFMNGVSMRRPTAE